ncbi:hypothetical protein ACQ33O_00555 [Ferruginibacter sp. SUN002]|uniref:hypothetical protein n=1 Tax=Ferruginibacter sp. SUN002 TaxID=2937789 RepID=UPI003D36E54A
MFFNLFGKKEEKSGEGVFVDRVFIDAAGKWYAILQLAKQQADTVFIAWFADTLKTAKELFAQNGIDEARVLDARHVFITMIENKQPVFLGHYPLHEKETALISNWPHTKIPVYSSLDEAIFKHFGSEKMIPLIKMLGMKEDEPIEHSYVTQSITRGQQKIAALVTLEQSASSQQEWMERNIKG